MNMRSLQNSSFVVFLAALGGCGGGSSSAGIEGSGVRNPGTIMASAITSSGAVTELGSIFVNGVEYDLAGASITIDGNPGTEADLDVGSIVIVEGELDPGGQTGTARRVTAGIALAGPIAALDAALNRLTVFGQTVEVDPITVIENRIDGLALGGLAVGDDVEVTGFADSMGVWTARRIAPRRSGTPWQITGRVADLDSTSRTFSIGGQGVDYGGADLVGFGSQTLAGASVRVTVDAVDADGALVAQEVAFRNLRLPGQIGDLAVLQGWVTRFASITDFDVDGHAVVTGPGTFIGGAEGQLGTVRLDAFVNVKGRLIAGGVVEATEVRQNTLVSLDSVVWGIEDGFVAGELTAFYGYRCHLEADTVVMVDGLHTTIERVAPGDVATIYEHHPNDGTPSRCQIIAVEHNVRGPIESLPTDSASMVVMGQRVWLDTASSANRTFQLQAFQELSALNVGDMVEVSGHTSAQGDVLAKSIRAVPPGGAYRVIGFVRAIDTVLKRFQLGELTIDYASANVTGFANDEPAEGVRVLVVSEFEPNAGVLRATVVRDETRIPRGATGAVLKLNGVVTRYVSPDDFDIEGRRTEPFSVPYSPPQDERLRCDMSKVHTDMRFERLIALSIGVGEAPLYFRSLCMLGRRIDAEGLDDSGFYESSPLSVVGPVQSIDLVNRSVRIAGVELMLLPSTLLTRFDAPAAGSTDVTTVPLFLEDLVVGDRVLAKVDSLPGIAGIRPVSLVWLGDAARLPEEEVRIKAELQGASAPDLELKSGIRIQVPPTAVFEGEGCYTMYDYEAADFWTKIVPVISSVTVSGSMSGGEFVPSKISFPDPTDAGCDW